MTQSLRASDLSSLDNMAVKTEPAKEALSERLRRFREDKGLSIKATAQAIGVSVSTYRDWEYGRAILGEPYEQITKVFGVSVSSLLLGTMRGSEKRIRGEIAEMRLHLSNLEEELGSLF